MIRDFDIVILGLSITSSWGNGHATTWRSLVKGLSQRGHRVLFLERDVPWYAANRDEPNPMGAVTILYGSLDELKAKYEAAVQHASLVIVGSYVPEGVQVGEWAIGTAGGRCVFYDIDTPVTLERLDSGHTEYICEGLIPRYDAYFSFTGGPTLRRLETQYGSPMARALYCSVDQDLYSPAAVKKTWDLGYLGTYSDDRQPLLDELLLQPAKGWMGGKFAVVGPQYPSSVVWPGNVARFEHLSPAQHPAFYGAQRFTLNITRQAMRSAGYSPSVRLFEAAACGVPVISDWWEGLDSIFNPGEEIFISNSAEDSLRYLRDVSEAERGRMAEAARKRVLKEHTPLARAMQVETYLKEMNDHVSTDTSRRNRSVREVFSGLDAGVAFKPERQAAGDGTLAAIGEAGD